MGSEGGAMELSPLDQIMPRLYSRIVLPFSLEAEELDATALRLRKSLARTVQEIPFLAWNVVASSQGRGRVKLSSQSEVPPNIWTVKDLRKPCSEWMASMEELREEKYPMDKLDGDILAPLPMMPDPQKPAPVFAAQFNYLDGGALLCVAFHHSVLDANGFATVLKMWANESNLHEQDGHDLAKFPRSVQKSDLDRQQIHGHGWVGEASEFPEYSILEPQSETASEEFGISPSFSLLDMTTTTFCFPANSLSELKNHVTESIAEQEGPDGWISTNDALCALLWQRTSLARFGSSSPPSSITGANGDTALPSHSRLGLAINGRSKLTPPLPSTYIGNLNLYGTSNLPLPLILAENSLGAIALSIRHAISSIDDAKIRRTISFIEQLSDVALLAPGFKSFLGPDLAITSWADLELRDLDWGPTVGGKAKSVRIVKSQFDGLCIMLPRLADGGLEVVVGLQTEHMERLRRDEVFGRFASLSST